jgi:hypothetical protein
MNVASKIMLVVVSDFSSGASAQSAADCKYCDRQPSLGESYQCSPGDIARNSSFRQGPYLDCTVTKQEKGDDGHYNNKCEGHLACSSYSQFINRKKYYLVSVGGSCGGSLGPAFKMISRSRHGGQALR